MGTISARLSKAAGVAIGVPITAIVGQLAVNQYSRNPWFVVSWGQALFGVQGFSMFCAGSIGFGAGVMLTRVSQSFDKNRFRHLTTDIIEFDHEMAKGLPFTKDRIFYLIGKVASIERQASVFGIPSIDFQDPVNQPTQISKGHMAYLQILPLLRTGDKRGACKIIDGLNKIEASRA
jgi:hypothetical protein